MNGRQRTETARALMLEFAQRTGLTSRAPPRRYLWTDAFAVCNFLELHRATGEAALRVVAPLPHTAGLFRLDQLIAALARERLWLADAYYAGTTPYVQALRSAASDGVDVRLLVPSGTDNKSSAAPVALTAVFWL